MIHETPWQIESCRYFRGESANAEGFGGIVTAVYKIDPKLFG
jgi:hypothetical protein